LETRLFHLNVWIYGLVGFLLPWIGIKLIDAGLTAFKIV
jgi:high-affinity K+ transport system ATPase subunit B